MSPFAAAGATAAAYDLGLLHKLAPSVFTDDKGFDLRTALIAGLLGVGAGALYGSTTKDQAVARQQELEQALHRSQMILAAERSAMVAREQLLQTALQRAQEQRVLSEVARRAAIDAAAGHRPLHDVT